MADTVQADAVDQLVDQWRAQRPDLDPTPMGVFGRVSRLARLVEKRIKVNLAPLGIDPADFDVLASLRRAGTPHRLTHAQLADSMMITAQAVTGRIDRLEQRELVRRTVDPKDRRCSFVELTAEGRETVDRAVERHLDLESSLLDDLSDGDRTALADALRVLIAALE